MNGPVPLARDPVFKGCTREATFLGVPMLPFLISAGGCVVLAMYFSLWFLTLVPITVLICRQLCANDDAFFQLAFLRLSTRTLIRNVRANQGTWRVDALEVRDAPLRALARMRP